ncbi:histidine kinase [Streptomyces sp. NBC_00572]|uniref:sensor histidine kinase n=1 Tax=Streptomyces sp. NBC_00572 TaxID=2903664 RepID=UPI002B1D92B9|nr:histidine kinase [Streptomyces sp. NBC_00572]
MHGDGDLADTGNGAGVHGTVTRTTTPSWPRRGLGTLIGCATALVGALHFLVVGAALGPFLLWPRTRSSALEILMAGARRLVTVERARRSAFFADLFPEHYQASDRKILRYLAIRSYTGLLCGVVIALLVFGAVLAGLLAHGAVRGTLGWDELLTQVLLGGVLLFLDVQGLYSLAALDARTARECFGPSERELLQHRIDELATSRAAVVEAVDAERRRIERDLHDGVQQRLVALAMLIGRARRGRDPEQADALLLQAHQESQGVLTELREVAWRVYPSALDSLGLEEAIGGVAERCGIPLRTRFEVGAPLPRPVETAAYFVVSESVTNAAKHSSASAISVAVALEGARLTVRVEDDGTGGARETGSGLTGLRSRVAALDGVLHIHSPLGGPTTITAELPCA